MTTDDDRSAGASGLPAELFTTIDHVGIAVPDLDEAIAFYAQAFGVHSVHEETNEEQGVREAMLAVGDGQTRIQLVGEDGVPDLVHAGLPGRRWLERIGGWVGAWRGAGGTMLPVSNRLVESRLRSRRPPAAPARPGRRPRPSGARS